MANQEVGKVTVSDVSGKLIYYVATRNGWFDGYSRQEIIQKANYMNLQLDWTKSKSR